MMPGIRKYCARGLMLATLLLPALVLAEPQVLVKDMRIWAGPDSTRVVFDLSGVARHEIFSLADPDRLVIDIPAAHLALAGAVPAGQGLVSAFRTAEKHDGSLRIVLDLRQAVVSEAFFAPPNDTYGHRLVVDLASRRAPTGAAAPDNRSAPSVVKSVQTPPGRARDIIVAVDAGHGGEDPGAIGRRGTREKNVTLAIAKRLKASIDREPGMRAVLTRSGDYFISLRERIRRARREQADMFVSVHADSVRDRSVAGSSVYVLSARGASDEASLWLAQRENAADLVGGVSLDDKDDVLASVLIDLSQGASMSASNEAAQKVLTELNHVGSVRRRQVQHAGFVVLKSPDIPSMLVETAFISNPGEETRLRDARHQERLAAAIQAGVRNYFYGNPLPGTLIAELKSQGNGMRHIIARGDTLSTIADQYRVSLTALKSANGLRGDTIAVGQVLEIPSGALN
jgi:N-acetylmuramoyl-L-alanine amidase